MFTCNRCGLSVHNDRASNPEGWETLDDDIRRFLPYVLNPNDDKPGWQEGHMCHDCLQSLQAWWKEGRALDPTTYGAYGA